MLSNKVNVFHVLYHIQWTNKVIKLRTRQHSTSDSWQPMRICMGLSTKEMRFKHGQTLTDVYIYIRH